MWYHKLIGRLLIMLGLHSLYTFPILIWPLTFGLCFYNWKISILIWCGYATIYWIYPLLFKETYETHSENSQFRSINYLDYIQKYYPWKTFYKDIYDNGPYIIACYPHGIFPVNWFAQFVSHKLKPIFLCASVVFRSPGSKEILRVFGGVPATNKSIDNALKQNRSVLLTPGGVREILLAKGGSWNKSISKSYGHDEGRYMYILRRMGFIKAAYRTKTPIIPAIAVGADEMYDSISIKSDLLKKFMGTNIFFIKGSWDFASPKSHVKVCNIVGKPIDPQDFIGDEKTVCEEIQKKVYDELTLLVEEHAKICQDHCKVKLFIIDKV